MTEELEARLAERERAASLKLLTPYMPAALQRAFLDPAVSEIMCNAPNAVFVERAGTLQPLEVPNLTDKTLKRIAQHVAHRQNISFSPDEPLLDCRLPDGSRLAAVSPPVAATCTLTIRKYGVKTFTLERLVELRSLPQRLADRVAARFLRGGNTVVSGGTGTGKTTFLCALLQAAAPSERIVTVEDTREIRIDRPNRVHLETRGSSSTTIRQLVRAALRHRPDRLVVGEVRGGEAYDLLQALNTGHGGSLTTVHANTAEAALSRLATMAMQARGVTLDHGTACHMVAQGVHQVVQLTRDDDGRRHVQQAIAVRGYGSGSGFAVETLREALAA